MSGEEPSVRRGASETAARVSGALNWLAIGGIAGAVAIGVIEVQPSSRTDPASHGISRIADSFIATSTDTTAAASTDTMVSLVEPAPAADFGDARPEQSSAALVPTADNGATDAGATGTVAVAEPIRLAAAPRDKTRSSRQSGESKPSEKPSEKPAEKPAEATASPGPGNAPAAADATSTWSEDVIRSAREECTVLMGNLAAEWSVAPPMRTMSCGAPGPITLRSVGTAKVTLTPSATTNCSTAAALSRWMDQYVQPAAMKHFGARVATVAIATSYDCRNRYGQAQAPLSEHALANAIDLSGFKLTDGRTVNVLGNWGPTARSTQVASAEAVTTTKSKTDGKGVVKASPAAPRMGLGAKSGEAGKAATAVPTASTPTASPMGSAVARTAEAEFLHAVHSNACSVFGTVLGPEANEAHRDHFHLDMKYRRRNSFCQ